MLKFKKIPHTFAIVFFIILIAAVLTWIIPPGKYTSEKVEVKGKEQTVMVFRYDHNLTAEELETMGSGGKV